MSALIKMVQALYRGFGGGRWGVGLILFALSRFPTQSQSTTISQILAKKYGIEKGNLRLNSFVTHGMEFLDFIVYFIKVRKTNLNLI